MVDEMADAERPLSTRRLLGNDEQPNRQASFCSTRRAGKSTDRSFENPNPYRPKAPRAVFKEI